ncbi:MAG: exo-alpha-sialidase [Actinobacteria bacterium]|nr:exo-alpha-sialidase [Actinomycetota bacterium]
MRRAALAALCALALAGCGFLEPRERILPAGFAEPRLLLVSDEAQGPLLVGGNYGLRTSLDGGRTWTTPEGGDEPVLAAGPYADRVMVSRGATGVAYGYALDGAPDEARAWPFPGNVVLLAGSARRDRLWAVAAVRGQRPMLQYSNDGGRTWWRMAALGLCPRPRALAVGPIERGRPERLWVACGRRGLLISDDLGVNFRRITGLADVRDVAAARSRAGHAVILTPRVRVTFDGGATWRAADLDAVRVAVDPRNADLVFAVGPNGSLHASLDGGRGF